jgi:PIN domain nuclease of toxin-antitoxin system
MSDSKTAYLLDTNVAIWLDTETNRVPNQVTELIGDPASALWVSTVAFWELAIKQRAGKIDARLRVERVLATYGMRELGITSKYTDALRDLPRLHGDPFDRMLVAQAMVEGMVLVTSDGRLAEYPVAVLRV